MKKSLVLVLSCRCFHNTCEFQSNPMKWFSSLCLRRRLYLNESMVKILAHQCCTARLNMAPERNLLIQLSYFDISSLLTDVRLCYFARMMRFVFLIPLLAFAIALCIMRELCISWSSYIVPMAAGIFNANRFTSIKTHSPMLINKINKSISERLYISNIRSVWLEI